WSASTPSWSRDACSTTTAWSRSGWTTWRSCAPPGAGAERVRVTGLGHNRPMKLNRRQLIAAAGAAAAVGAPAGAAQQAAGTTGSRVPVVDIHTHMYTRRWLDALKASGDADTVVVPGNPESISYRGVNYA